MIKSEKKILIATGGTGGHVFPAYSLAKHFIKNQISVEIITDKRGFQFLKNYEDIKLKIINSATIFKKNPISIIISIIQIKFAFISSLIFLFKSKPRIVFGMGGYSSFPVCIAAKVLRIPFIIYENNLVIGKANKFLLPFADKIFVSYSQVEGIKKKYEDKKIEIGNIIREEAINFNKNISTSNREEISILILGGSQAAKSFAEVLPEVFERCMELGLKLKIYQQCLLDQKDELNRKYKSMNIEFELFNFTHNILNYFSKIDLAITRSGSSILAELLNCKIPFISIPFPYAADNHQLKNAKYFEKKGYGFLIEENQIKIKLFPLIKSIHEDKALLSEVRKRQNTYSDKSVFENINNQIRFLINE